MPFRKSLAVAALLALSAAPLAALQAKPVDLTGIWTGTFHPSDGGQSPAHLDLKQKGTELTGTAGPDLGRQMTVANGKVTTEKDVTSLTFEVTLPDGPVLKFDLRVVEGRLKGRVTAEQDGQKREALLDVGRAK